MAPFSGKDGGMALCPQRGGDETHGRATDAERCAPFYLHFAIHFDSVIERKVYTSLSTPPSPRHNIPAPHTYTLTLPAEYHRQEDYLIDVFTIVVPL